MPLPQDPRARRRRRMLLGVAVAALAAGAAAGAERDREERVAGGREEGAVKPAAVARRPGGSPAADPLPADSLAAARRLALERRVGRLVVMRFRGYPAPAYVPRALRKGWAGGVILFRDNAPSAPAVRALTARLRAAGGARLLVLTDQEGGAIRTLRWAAPAPAQSALATPAAAAAAGRAAARDLRAAGVNVNLAPVLDAGWHAGSVMSGRAFAGGAAQIAAHARAAVRAYRGTRVAPTLKHFPGLGAARANTDDFAVTLRRRPAELVAEELQPFGAGIDAGAPAVMMSHALYPALDPERIASQSHAVVTRLLRGRLGFDGVVMTDSLEARAVSVRSSVEMAALRSVRAGVDVILTTGPGSHLRVVRALLAEARRDRAFRARVTESAARVIALQRSLAPSG